MGDLGVTNTCNFYFRIDKRKQRSVALVIPFIAPSRKRKGNMALLDLYDDLLLFIITFITGPEFIAFTSACRGLQRFRNPPYDGSVRPWQYINLQVTWVMCTVLNNPKPRNVLMHGPGGCGKSYTLGKLHDAAVKNNIPIVMTSTTGISAFNLPNGSTLHSWLKIGKGTMPLVKFKEKFEQQSAYYMTKYAYLTKPNLVLVLDEVSMLGIRVFNIINFIFQFARNSNLPFGGVTTVFCGDFLQIPPVGDYPVFESPLWGDLNPILIEFETPFRQRQDLTYFQLLQRVRVGQQTPEDIKFIQSRTFQEVPRWIEEGVGNIIVLLPATFSSIHRLVNAHNIAQFTRFVLNKLIILQ